MPIGGVVPSYSGKPSVQSTEILHVEDTMEGNTVCKESTSRFVPKCLLFPFWVRKTCQKLSPCGVKPQRSLPVILARFLWALVRFTQMMIIRSRYLCVIRFPLLLRSFSPPSSPLRLVRLRWMELSLPRLKGRPVIPACVLHCRGRGAHYYNLLPQMDIRRLKAASRCRILSTFTFLP